MNKLLIDVTALFVLDQHNELDLYSAIAHCNKLNLQVEMCLYL
jgi:hypothetical protein